MPASKYELRNGTGTRFVFPEVSVDDIRNNVSGGGGGGGGSTTTITNTLPGSTGYVRVPCAPCAPCNPSDCASLLADCQAAGNELLGEYNELVEEYNEIVEDLAVICEKFVPPNGTFLYSELNSSRAGDYRTYSYSVGTLELRPETITSPFDKKIEWTESANINYSYDLQISTNIISYDGPKVFIGASGIIVKNPSGSIVTSINTLITGTYTVLVNFSANLGNKYPAPDYFPIGEFTISQTAPDDLPNSDTVIGYTDYGCPEL